MKTFRNLLLEMAKVSAAAGTEVETHYEHAADAVFNDGHVGAMSIANSFTAMIDSSEKHLGTKVEGSPSVLYGIEGGKHWIAYKGAKQKSFTPEDIDTHYADDPIKKRDRSALRGILQSTLSHISKIHNGVEGEVHQGDVMWHQNSTPTITSIGGVDHYTFRPNVIRNAIPVDSVEGKRVKRASFGFAPHTVYRNETSYNFTSKEEQQHPDVHLIDSSAPPIPREHIEGLHGTVHALKMLISSTSKEHLDYSSRPDIVRYLSPYASEKRRLGGQIGQTIESAHASINFDDFSQFVHRKIQSGIDKLTTDSGKAKASAARAVLLADMKHHQEHLESGFKVHKAIASVGDAIRRSLDTQHTIQRFYDTESGSMEAANVEGYVFKPVQPISHHWYKLVDPQFTRRNNEAHRPVPVVNEAEGSTELTRTGKSDHAVVSFGRGMGHIGHMHLASSVITHAAEHGADPYVILSKKVGKDDPLTAEEKIGIHRTVFPQHARAFQSSTDAMPSFVQVLQHLYKHGYKKVTTIVGEDQKATFERFGEWNGLFKEGRGYKFDEMQTISRQETNDPSKLEEGPRATDMREILTDPTKTSEEQFTAWRSGMHPAIPDTAVRGLMQTAKERITSFVKPKKLPKTITDSIIHNMMRYILEDGEAPPASSGQMTSDGSGIAGLGDDARAGNVIVRKRPRMFKRRKR